MSQSHFSGFNKREAVAFLHQAYVPSIRVRYDQLVTDLDRLGAPEPGFDDDSLNSLWSWFRSVYVDEERRPFAEHGIAAKPPQWIEGYLPDVGDREIRFVMTAFASVLHLRLHQKFGTDIYAVQEAFLNPQLGRSSSSVNTLFVESSLIGAGRRALARDSSRSPIEVALVTLANRFEQPVVKYAGGPPSLEPASPQVIHAGSPQAAGLDPMEHGQVEIVFDELTSRAQRGAFALLLRDRSELRGIVSDEDPGYIVATLNGSADQIEGLVAELWDEIL